MIGKRGIAAWACLLLGVILAGDLEAQVGGDSIPGWRSVDLLTGEWVKAQLRDGSEVRGRVLGVHLTHLSVLPRRAAQAPVEVELGAVSELWVKEGDRAESGALLGAVVGLAIGTAYVHAVCQGKPGDRCTSDFSAKVFIGFGAGAGGVIGLLAGLATPRWRLVSF